MHQGIALAAAGIGGVVLHPCHRVELQAAGRGLEKVVHVYVSQGDVVGGAQRVEPQGVAAADEEGVAVLYAAHGEGMLLDGDGLVEGVVGEEAAVAALRYGGVEFYVVDGAVVADGYREGQAEKADGVQRATAGIVDGHIAGHDVGSVEPFVEGDGVALGGHQIDGVDMQERRGDEVVVGARGAKHNQQNRQKPQVFHYIYICFISEKRGSCIFIICK